MKQLVIVLVIILIIIAVVVLLRSGAPEDLERSVISEPENNNQNNTSEQNQNTLDMSQVEPVLHEFSFVGFGPGRSHDGTFGEFRVENASFDESGKPLSGKLVVQVDSVSTDAGDMLNNHLCTEDFFDCARYPEIVFELVRAEEATDSATGQKYYQVTGNLSFHGITKSVSFRVNQTGGESLTYSADFVIDTTPFQFKFTAIDNEVRIRFSGELLDSSSKAGVSKTN